MKKFSVLFIFFMCISLHSSEVTGKYNLYFFGLVNHFNPVEETNEGNMNYFSISKTSGFNDWKIEGGVGRYMDSYNINSYKLYANISKEGYRLGLLQPILSLAVHSKGVEYGSTERKLILIPSFKLRVGDETGLFITIMPIPKVFPFTNGFVATEFGYSF